jgi:hypothetical protein
MYRGMKDYMMPKQMIDRRRGVIEVWPNYDKILFIAYDLVFYFFWDCWLMDPKMAMDCYPGHAILDGASH